MNTRPTRGHVTQSAIRHRIATHTRRRQHGPIGGGAAHTVIAVGLSRLVCVNPEAFTEWLSAIDASEAFAMPSLVHGGDDGAEDGFGASRTPRRAVRFIAASAMRRTGVHM